MSDHHTEIAALTDRGLLRSSNEDCFLVLEDLALPSRYQALAGVFDGVGGQAHGGRASSAAAKYLAQLVGGPAMPLASRRPPNVELEEVMQQLHEMLRLDGLYDPALRGMATTATVALVAKASEPTLWLGHVGDSPAFRLRGGRLQKLLREDSVVCDLVANGLVAPADAAKHPQRHVITQSLGSHRDIQPHVASHALEPGDCIMLCTDGLTNIVPEDDIAGILQGGTPRQACEQLVEAAKAAGGTDNVTVIVMKFTRGDDANPKRQQRAGRGGEHG